MLKSCNYKIIHKVLFLTLNILANEYKTLIFSSCFSEASKSFPSWTYRREIQQPALSHSQSTAERRLKIRPFFCVREASIANIFFIQNKRSKVSRGSY